jgi:hypothetical protein
MDSGIIIVLLIAMYVIPEILKRLKPKKPYQYPEFPSTLPPTEQGPAKPPSIPVLSGEGMPGDEGDPFWQIPKAAVSTAVPETKRLSPESFAEPSWGSQGVAMGIIWAEIIAPPVSLRPMRRGVRRL